MKLVFVADEGVDWPIVQRLPAALAPLPLGLYEFRQELLVLGTLELGSALLAIGFLTLLAGVAVNWTGRRSAGAGPGPRSAL